MENQLLLLLDPGQLALAATSALLLVGLLFGQYYKTRFLPLSPRPSGISLSEQRRMPRMENHSILELGDALGRWDTTARLVNISLGGICFTSLLKLKKDEAVQAKLRSFQNSLLHLSGRIAWSKTESHHTRYGLEIESVTESRS